MTGQNQRGQDSWLSSSLQRTDAQGGLDAAPQQPRASRDEPKGHQNKPHWENQTPLAVRGIAVGSQGLVLLPGCLSTSASSSRLPLPPTLLVQVPASVMWTITTAPLLVSQPAASSASASFQQLLVGR